MDSSTQECRQLAPSEFKICVLLMDQIPKRKWWEPVYKYDARISRDITGRIIRQHLQQYPESYKHKAIHPNTLPQLLYHHQHPNKYIKMTFGFSTKSSSKDSKTDMPTTYVKEVDFRDSSSTYSFDLEKNSKQQQLSAAEKKLIKGKSIPPPEL